MSAKKKYLTIKEYAEIRGVSVSSVYKRLNSTLQPFLVTVDNQKMLKREVLKEEGLKDIGGGVEEVSTNDSTPDSTAISALKSELERQIRLNEELLEQVREKDAHIMKMSEKMMELTEQSHILLQNNQRLMLAQQDSPEPESEPEQEPEPEAAAEPPQPEKEQPRGFFSRLFG